MLTKKILKEEYEKKHQEIKRRLREFEDIGKKKSLEDKFIELCFCICTPQSNAKRVAQAINKQNLSKLMKADQEDLSSILKTNCRFHNNKAGYIILARKYIKDLDKLPKDPMQAREFIVANIKGVGYKEASHFLRNIGYRDICIIDRHIVNLLHELTVFKTTDMPKSRKQYLQMEEQIKRFAASIGMDVDELDLLLWSIKTGFVFR